MLFVLALLAGGCSSDRRADKRDEPAAREAGREAYRASEDVKRGAKEAGREADRASEDLKRGANEAARDLKDAGKEFRQGWNEEKHREPARATKRRNKDSRDQQ